jgi:hypothetical protein
MPIAGGFIGLSGIGTSLKVGITTERLPPLGSAPAGQMSMQKHVP